jgi:hypothetical protein
VKAFVIAIVAEPATLMRGVAISNIATIEALVRAHISDDGSLREKIAKWPIDEVNKKENNKPHLHCAIE